MTTPYLPKWATIEESCTWLEEQTGEEWPAVRLLESWIVPSVKIDYTPGLPKELSDAVFGYRTEGFLAPLCFNLDQNMMAATRTGMMTMTFLPDGKLCKFTPGLPFDLDEVRYAAADLARLASKHSAPAIDSRIEAHGIQKHEVAAAFRGLHFGYDAWKKALDGTRGWLANCRVTRGRRGKESALWNPVLIGKALMDKKGVPENDIDKAFRSHLKTWHAEWREANYRD